MGRIQEHNREIMSSAKFRAEEMKTWPSPLEERMQVLLDLWGIVYESQNIFYIYADDGWIIRYYIADFYIPEKDIIIEVDGKFHNNQVQKDKNRTKVIQEHYPEIEVLMYAWEDLNDEDTMEELLWELV
jgi:very-short-patch-repair endonuclease